MVKARQAEQWGIDYGENSHQDLTPYVW
jgi:hypothetical protein